MLRSFYLTLFYALLIVSFLHADISVYCWRPEEGTNFGDELSIALVERIVGKSVRQAEIQQCKLLAIGSVIQFAKNRDVIWGAGMNGNDLKRNCFPFEYLDVRAVRGPLTKKFLSNLGISAPSIYGDPALLLPYFFPEFKLSSIPKYDYVVIPHLSEVSLFTGVENVVLPTEPWEQVIEKILQSKFVISSSLHGLIIAEAFGIPARMLRVTYNEPDFKYLDYYLGTGRATFNPAFSIEEALKLGGEPPPSCDLDRLLQAFPYEYFFTK